jgi:hypothetical protein
MGGEEGRQQAPACCGNVPLERRTGSGIEAGLRHKIAADAVRLALVGEEGEALALVRSGRYSPGLRPAGPGRPGGPMQIRLSTLLTLGLLSGLTPFAIDMYLPSLPAIAQDLDSTIELAQLSVTAYLGVFALAQLVTGPGLGCARTARDHRRRSGALLCGCTHVRLGRADG